MNSIGPDFFDVASMYMVLSTFTALASGWVFIGCSFVLAVLWSDSATIKAIKPMYRRLFTMALVCIVIHVAIIAGIVTPGWPIFFLALAAADVGCLSLILLAALLFHYDLITSRKEKKHVTDNSMAP
jgi:hypothetical protein